MLHILPGKAKKEPEAEITGMMMSYLCIHYRSPSLIGTTFLPSNSVLTREVSFGEREDHIH